MKKKIFSILGCFCLAFSCLFGFAGCKKGISLNLNIELYSLHYNLNGGSFTQEFKDLKGITEANYIPQYNKNYFGGANESIAKAGDLIAPNEDVIFAGWFIDEDCSSGNEWNEWNLDKYWEDEEHKSVTIKAKWVNKNDTLAVIDLGKYVAIKESGLHTTNYLISATTEGAISTETLFNNLQTLTTNLEILETKLFDYWKVNDTKIESKTNIDNAISARPENDARIFIEPVLKDREIVQFDCSINLARDTNSGFDQDLADYLILTPGTYSENAINYYRQKYGNLTQANCFDIYSVRLTFYKDLFNEELLNSLIADLPDMEEDLILSDGYFSRSGDNIVFNDTMTFHFDGWKFYDYTNKEFLELTKENALLRIEDCPSQVILLPYFSKVK